MDELDVYKMVVLEDDDFSGMNMISLVENPAHKQHFLAFEEMKPLRVMKFDEKKKELVGAFIVPEMKILREDPRLGRFHVVFDSPTITTILRKFQKNNFSNNISLAHSGRIVKGFVQEIWQKEFEQDKSNAYGFNLPIGTLFGKVRIEDQEFWDTRVETDEVRGFSIEILSGLEKINMSSISEETLFTKIVKIIDKALED